MQVYNKMVRDKIPEIMVNNGEKPIIQILDDKEYRFNLEQKLNEEVNEYHESKRIEELADILEVVYALCELNGYTQEDLMDVYQQKHAERGGFSKKIFLIRKE